MILEVATLYVLQGRETQFEKDFATAGQYISSIQGYIRHSLRKCLQQANKYLLLVEWESVEAHAVGFRQSVQYQQWKELLHHYYDPFPVVEYYEMVAEGASKG